MYRIPLFVLVPVFLIVSSVHAQPFAVVDIKTGNFGIIGGSAFGQGKVQGGFALSAYHPYQVTPLNPSFELDAMLVWSSTKIVALGFLGGSVTLDSAAIWSINLTIVLTQPKPIAFRGSIFVGWAPADNGVFIQGRAGLSVALDSKWKIFPHLIVTMADTRQPTNLTLGPGWMILRTF